MISKAKKNIKRNKNIKRLTVKNSGFNEYNKEKGSVTVPEEYLTDEIEPEQLN